MAEARLLHSGCSVLYSGGSCFMANLGDSVCMAGAHES